MENFREAFKCVKLGVKFEDVVKTTTKNDTSEEDEKIEKTMLLQKPTITFKDICGMENEKTELESAVLLPIKFPSLFSRRVKPYSGFLFYGVNCLFVKQISQMNKLLFFLATGKWKIFLSSSCSRGNRENKLFCSFSCRFNFEMARRI
jgi:hypothetical protein